MTVRPAYWFALYIAGLCAVFYAGLTLRLLPLVIWLVACLVAITYGKETRNEH